MNYPLPYINSTTTSINNDIALFKDGTKNQLYSFKKKKKIWKKQNVIISKNKDLETVLKQEKRINKSCKIGFKISLFGIGI